MLGYEMADRLFDDPAQAIGRPVRVGDHEFAVKGVLEKKGRVLGQSFNRFVLISISTFETMYGRSKTTVVSVKMPTADAISPRFRRSSASRSSRVESSS
ncbi:MAG: ABC transporter permease [Gemmatimonadales bacterium]